MQAKILNIAYAINEAYVDYCIVSMASILKNNSGKQISFHILTDHLSAKAKSKIQNLITHHNLGGATFYEISDSKVSHLALNGWGKYAWYRLFLPELLDSRIDKVLYLDTDTIICGDISDLFATDLRDHSLAGCMDIMGFYDGIFQRVGYPKEYGYICSGVILMNLDYFREHDLSTKIMDFSTLHPERINFPDQDAINCVCHTSMKLLPLKYDMLAPFFTDEAFIKSHTEEVKDMLHDPRIIHYAGCNPWIIGIEKHFHYHEFWKYAHIVGDIKAKHIAPFDIRSRIAVKRFLGILGIPKFKKYRPKKRPDFSLVSKLK